MGKKKKEWVERERKEKEWEGVKGERKERKGDKRNSGDFNNYCIFYKDDVEDILSYIILYPFYAKSVGK